MSAPPNSSSRANRWHWLPAALGAAVAALGLTVMVGWSLRSAAILEAIPSLLPMRFNTALGFALCGTGLILAGAGRRRAAALAGGIAAAVGLLTLVQYATGLDLGIDQLFVAHHIAAESLHPGRMAPNTAVSFLLAGVALVARCGRAPSNWRLLWQRLAGAAVLLLGVLALLAYATGIESAYGWGRLTRMAVYTAAGLVLFATGLLAATRGQASFDPQTLRGHPETGLRQIIGAGVLGLAAVALTVGLVALHTLYQQAITRELCRMESVASSWESLARAVAQSDEEQADATAPGSAAAQTLRKMAAAQNATTDPAHTDEILIVKRTGDNITFLLPRRHPSPDELPYYARWAEPARRGLAGKTGTIIGPDYRGETVLAAYRPVGIHGWAVVAKMDQKEVRRPFLRTALLILGTTALLIGLGAWMLLTTATPLARHLVGQQRELASACQQAAREAAMRQQAEEELAAQHAQLVAVFDGVDEPIYVCDPITHETLYMNAPARERWGVATGRRCFEVLQGRTDPCPHCTTMENLREDAELVVTLGERNQLDQRVYRRSHRAIRWPDNRVVRFVMAIDITEQHEAREQLAQQQRVSQHANQMLLAGHSSDTVEALADRCLELVQNLVGAQIGLVGELNERGRLDSLALTAPSWTACRVERAQALRVINDMEVRGVWSGCLLRGESVLTNDPAQHADSVGLPEGHPPITSFLGVPLQLEGRPVGVIALANKEGGFTDADQDAIETLAVPCMAALVKKRAEVALQRSNEVLEERVQVRTADLQRSNQELEQFASVASHDLQEPLRMVASYMQLLQQRYQNRLDQDANEFIGFAVDGANRMKDLIDGLLAFSRVGTRGEPPQPVNVNAVLEQVLTVLGPTIRERDATVESDSLPTVLVDGLQLRQLLQNLVSNALKFCQERPPHIEVGAEDEDTHWHFTVRDNGIGIAGEHRERIFTIFQRLHTRSEYPGTGMGLAICRKIVERHGGQIWVESEPGAGSVFHFTLTKSPSMEDSTRYGTRADAESKAGVLV